MSLELKHVQVSYHGKELFDPVDIKIDSGEVATIMGPSGCGKSTLLSAIAGNLEFGFRLTGTIVLNDNRLNDITMEKRKVGILFQDDLLFPHFNVKGNLQFAIAPEVSKKEKEQRVLQALSHAGLEKYLDRDVATLSGGEKARISLLRTLLAEPDALLLDEPFSKLDKPLRASFRKFVHEQICSLNIPTLLVTHNEEDSLGGEIYTLQGREVTDG